MAIRLVVPASQQDTQHIVCSSTLSVTGATTLSNTLTVNGATTLKGQQKRNDLTVKNTAGNTVRFSVDEGNGNGLLVSRKSTDTQLQYWLIAISQGSRLI